VRSAAEMRERLAALNEELERDRGVRLSIRTGVNTGEVVAGDASGGQKLVTGDAVNVAARLEQAAQPGEILIGADTRDLVREAVHVEAVAPLPLKGKTEPVPAWRLVEVLPEVPAVARRIDAPFVGRANELAELEQGLERAVDERACQLRTIVGPPGIGKSRLVRELVKRVGDRDYAGPERDLPNAQSVRIAGPVQTLVVMADDRCQLLVFDLEADHSSPVDRVSLDDRELLVGQTTGLVQDLDRGAYLADIVQAAAARISATSAGASPIREAISDA